MAKIPNIRVNEEYLAEESKPDLEKMHLLTFDPVHLGYLEIGKHVGNAFKDGTQLKQCHQSMNIEEVREYALSLPGTTEDQAYGKSCVLFRIEGKIYLHLWLDAPEPSCALKLPPEQGQALRDHYDGIRPAYHLNKVHWNDVLLDEIDGDMVKSLITQSYQLVLSKLPKRLREKYKL